MINSSSTTAQATTAPMSLLRLIANDAEFRAKVEADPMAAFAEHGIKLSSAPEKVALPEVFDLLEGEADPDPDDNGNGFKWRGLL